MKQLKNEAKRMLAVLVSLVLVVGMLPVSAFALTEGAFILNHPSLRVAENGSFTSTEVPMLQGDGKLTSSAGWGVIPEDNQLNVWIKSPEMTADGKDDGSVPPLLYRYIWQNVDFGKSCSCWIHTSNYGFKFK